MLVRKRFAFLVFPAVSRRQRAVKTGSADPATGLASWQRTKLRRAAGRLLVASAPVRDLLVRAKHLFVAAINGWGSPGLAPNWQIRT